MDLDELDLVPLSVTFPLPFRVLFLAGFGILAWATNLHGLDIMNVDVASAMDLRAPPPAQRSSGFKLFTNGATVYSPVYKLLTAYSLWCFFSWAVFRYATGSHEGLVDVFRYIPAISALAAITVLVSPFDHFQKRERDMFLHAIQRCLFSSHDRPTYFSDVVFADVFTSFAKVMGDVWLSLLMLLPGGSLLVLPTQTGWMRWILPALMSLPFLARLRQCLVDHFLPTNTTNRHLLNALKYATSFPVIFLSAAQRIVVSELVEEKGADIAKDAWHGEHQLFRLWLLAAAVNSLYSFWWDVTNDWGLDLLKIRSTSRPKSLRPLLLASKHTKSDSIPTAKAYPWGLRPFLLYPLPIYPLMIFLNLVLRLTWSLKLSSHLHAESEGSVAIFWLEVAELARRWMWVFLRVEWEVVKKSIELNGGPVKRTLEEEEEYELLENGND